jgi:hypothetical protein
VTDFRMLPFFEVSRSNAFRMLGKAADELRSDWHPGHAPTARQLTAIRKAQRAIADAKAALDEAVRR